ncbi:hypothetical protein VFPBJ_02425 [Purpureocillium lilacinum]|uniref:Uncharacterized protein n=1 Tax=Purpureocillium lilacinum TaxID=33203 RepID=A0A179H085_PURLI|nr:hypothetical protein VFPBJ_02425 [Purpureocillium lilacinum]
MSHDGQRRMSRLALDSTSAGRAVREAGAGRGRPHSSMESTGGWPGHSKGRFLQTGEVEG